MVGTSPHHAKTCLRRARRDRQVSQPETLRFVRHFARTEGRLRRSSSSSSSSKAREQPSTTTRTSTIVHRQNAVDVERTSA